MSKNLRNRFLVIFGVVVVSLFFTFPLEKRINLGLDLKGGMHLVLNIETEKLPVNTRNDAVLRAAIVGIVEDDIARIPELIANSLGRHLMKCGDVVYGRRGDIGRR